MNTVAMPISGDAAVTHDQLGWQFINWGLSLFIAGFVVGFIPILHYMVGAQTNVGPAFLKNVTLWWGCPAVLAEMVIKHGSLGMLAIGLCYVVAGGRGASSRISGNEQLAVKLCAYGLIAEMVTAAVFFVIGNKIWPNFYFEPVPAGKNLWLGVQGLSILVYVVGLVYAVAGVRRAASSLR